MILDQDFEDFVSLLNKRQVEYMVVGGYALAFHGKPRHTGDLDIWINVNEQNAERMVQVMKDFGVSALGFTKKDFLKPGYISRSAICFMSAISCALPVACLFSSKSLKPMIGIIRSSLMLYIILLG